MSWQGNELFVSGIEYWHEDFNGQIIDALDAVMCVYEAHGNGWYMYGNIDSDEVEEDYDGFRSYCGGEFWSGWLPNPFMAPAVGVVRVRNMHDLVEVAFECADSNFDTVAYAGDYKYEPLEHVELRGNVFDMR